VNGAARWEKLVFQGQVFKPNTKGRENPSLGHEAVGVVQEVDDNV
jgi:hypothetical protein